MLDVFTKMSRVRTCASMLILIGLRNAVCLLEPRQSLCPLMTSHNFSEVITVHCLLKNKQFAVSHSFSLSDHNTSYGFHSTINSLFGIPYKQLLEKMYDGVRKRQCELSNRDVREHVDWMTRHADQAWRALETRVNKIEPKLKGIARTEENFKALKGVFRAIQERNHAEIEELKSNVHQLTGRFSEFHDDFRGMKMNVQMFKRNAKYRDQNIEELKNNYARINVSANTMNGNVQELRGQFEHLNGKANRLDDDFRASSRDIRQFKRTIDKKINEIDSNINGIRKKNQGEAQKNKSFINEKISQCKESARVEMKYNLNPLTNKMITIQQQIRQCRAQINKNSTANNEQIKNTNKNIQLVRKEVCQTKQKSQNLKNRIENIESREEKLEESIRFKIDQSKINAQVQRLVDRIRKVEEKEKTAREKLQNRIMGGTQATEVLSNKVADLQERTDGIQKLKEMMKEIKRNEEMEKERKLTEEVQEIQRKGEFEKLVDMETPHAARFLIQANNITYNQQNDGNFYQVLLGVVLGRIRLFVLHVHITNKNGYMTIGVVDRLTQRQERKSSSSGNAVCYYSGVAGYIDYGNNGQHKDTKTGVVLRTGDELRVEVNLDRGMATFSTGGGKFTQDSDILSQPHRQFVPFFQMNHKGDSIVWRIE